MVPVRLRTRDSWPAAREDMQVPPWVNSGDRRRGAKDAGASPARIAPQGCSCSSRAFLPPRPWRRHPMVSASCSRSFQPLFAHRKHARPFRRRSARSRREGSLFEKAARYGIDAVHATGTESTPSDASMTGTLRHSNPSLIASLS